MAKRNCLTPECDETCSDGSVMAYCRNCRNSMGRWASRKPKDRELRQSRLRVYSARIEQLTERRARVS